MSQEEQLTFKQIEHRMEAFGELARCRFDNKFETNNMSKMFEHIKEEHFKDVQYKVDIVEFVELTGKQRLPIDEHLSFSDMIAELRHVRMGMYDVDFFRSISSQYLQWGRLSDKQKEVVKKMHHKYRKQIARWKIDSANDMSYRRLQELKRYARVYHKEYVALLTKESVAKHLESMDIVSEMIEYAGAQYRKMVAVSSKAKELLK